MNRWCRVRRRATCRAGRRARCDERGSTTAFALAMIAAVLVCVGLVHDGGRLAAAKVEAADVAENAARAGAQQTRVLRGGTIILDEPAARAAAADFLADAGESGTVSIVGDSIVVSITHTEPMRMLAKLRVLPKTFTVTRSVEAVTA